MMQESEKKECLQAALQIIETVLGEAEPTCSILGRNPGEAVMIGTAEAYLELAKIALAFVLKVKCAIGPLDHLELSEFKASIGTTYTTCDVAELFAADGPYRCLVRPVCAYLVDSDATRVRIEAQYEEWGQ